MKDFIIAVIPARYASSRLPGKPLLTLLDKPLIQWVYESCCQAKLIDELWVATDDARIADCVRRFGGNVVMTSREAKTGTDRIIEALASPELINANIIINVQGDEPLIQAELIDQMVVYLQHNPQMPVVTAATDLPDSESNNANTVKVVTGHLSPEQPETMTALYFSRSPIPYLRNPPTARNTTYLRHIGLYGFRKQALLDYAMLPNSLLENVESLEQLRMLQWGWKIGLIKTEYNAIGVDTEEDLKRVTRILSEKR